MVGTTSKEVRVPEDRKACLSRTTPVRLWKALYAHLGVNAVTVDFSELYTALQQNLINGIYLQASWIDSSKLQENLDYITPTEVTYAISVKAMSSDAVEKLGPELLGIVMECGEEAEAYKDGLWMPGTRKFMNVFRSPLKLWNSQKKNGRFGGSLPRCSGTILWENLSLRNW